MKQTAIEPDVLSTVPMHVGIKDGLKMMLGKAKAPLASKSLGCWDGGRDLISIPTDRLNEIPKVLKEHREQEYERYSHLVYLRRVF